VVRGIQNTLNARYGFGLAADGVAGPLTRSAVVRALQTELNRQFGRNLRADGVFGPRTRAAAVNVRPGARGNMTYLIQAALYIRGYREVVPDGVFGPVTERAVRAFQNASGLTVDSVAGPNTQNALFRR
jgi:peptidoglycan L-alanyl-D-glutamate endopeptidase CwlK